MFYFFTMKTINKILFSYLLSFVFVSSIFGQTIVNSNGYQTDFEDEAERSKWVLNNGLDYILEKCVNKWFFGKPGANLGEMGLFISGDRGETNNYQNIGVSIVAYRELTLDEGDYELSFDWQAAGMTDIDGLYVLWIPVKDSIKINSVNNGFLQKWVTEYDYGLDFGRDSLRLNQRTWNTITDTIHSDGSAYNLVFVWNNGVAGPYSPAACIDNILILELGRCDRPTDLTVATKGDDVVMEWKGSADAYDVRCCNNMTGEWIEFNDVVGKSQVIEGLPEGMCTYYVRSKCGGIAGSWVSISKFLFYPAVRCIDYLNLSSNNCFIGTTDNPSSKRQVVDYGYQAMESRHTLHWNPLEYDPRTEGGLKTVPEGEIASVRLGNWGINAEAECVEYNYLVDTLTSAILLLNYAVVLEDPSHDSLDQPRFTLQILYQNRPLDKFGCGEAYFAAGFNLSEKDGWHQVGGIWYKDWTTIAINLKEYHGKSLKVKLTTYDCTLGGHYGYAYFTMGCSDGKIKGLTCGDADSTVFEGPEGFIYRWYLPNKPDSTIETSRRLSLPANDTLTYNLDVIQPTNKNCYYTLSASGVGRWPRAYAAYTAEVKNCQNVVTFDNKSYVKRINQITSDSVSTTEKCESFLWDFGDGFTSTKENPKHIFPDEGGVYKVTLSAGIAGDKCMDDTTFFVVLPKVGTVKDTTHAVVCKGSSYNFRGKFYQATGCYSDTVHSEVTGCDSIYTLDLFMAYPIDTIIYDTICSDEEYYFNGEKITSTGEYVFSGESIYGCDSIVRLNIVVNQALYADFDSVATVCVDDKELLVSYNITSGDIYTYTAHIKSDSADFGVIEDLKPQDNQLVIPLPDSIKPGIYTLDLQFGETCGGGKNETLLPLEVYYSKDILVQRWGDVLAVVNEQYNGGYNFVAYQWYKNGIAIEGATSSILYVAGGLDLTASYSVLLTRETDNVTLMTCNADLFDYSEEESSVVVFSENPYTIGVESAKNAKVKIWSSSGLLLKELDVEKGESFISLDRGLYIVEFIFEDNRHEIHQVIVE